MRYILVLICIIALPGCKALFSLPSFEYCSRVSYLREGNKININGECYAPVQSIPLPIPSPLEGL